MEEGRVTPNRYVPVRSSEAMPPARAKRRMHRSMIAILGEKLGSSVSGACSCVMCGPAFPERKWAWESKKGHGFAAFSSPA